jgi:hypothetical protein
MIAGRDTAKRCRHELSWKWDLPVSCGRMELRHTINRRNEEALTNPTTYSTQRELFVQALTVLKATTVMRPYSHCSVYQCGIVPCDAASTAADACNSYLHI